MLRSEFIKCLLVFPLLCFQKFLLSLGLIYLLLSGCINFNPGNKGKSRDKSGNSYGTDNDMSRIAMPVQFKYSIFAELNSVILADS